ncbi:XkdX family protein [Paenibacillus arenosi]|uniref:XkdX family protein n=1 Tax=Paenibacillus arenosi TaxID=2774142 RepID=A0ABR9B307_9BACL|nr:XkdX family protein [Paenibacillus arenosi]MBD8500754.1 XkdX family protein [Paenibacillus arenosi]
MEFWKYAFDMNWINADILRKAVRTGNNPSGEITPEQYHEITSISYV